MSDLEQRLVQRMREIEASLICSTLHERVAANTEMLKVKRERIATAALQGLLSGPLPDKSTYEQVTQHAVYCADALIAELDREVQP